MSARFVHRQDDRQELWYILSTQSQEIFHKVRSRGRRSCLCSQSHSCKLSHWVFVERQKMVYAHVKSQLQKPEKLSCCEKLRLNIGRLTDEEKQWFHQREIDDSNIDDEIVLPDAAGLEDDYEEIAIQFGYLALFAPAYHLAPFLAIIKDIYETRADAVEYCQLTRRSKWERCEDIGSWYTVLNAIGFLGVITNA